MQGMKFLLLNEKGIPLNHGTIMQRVTEDRFLCWFARVPQVSRLCHVEEISGWNLFPDEDALNEFISSIGKNKISTVEKKKAVDDGPIATIEPEENTDGE